VRQVREYNFRSPHKFSRQQLRAVQVLHESWARNLATMLGADLNTSVQVTVAEVRQVPYGAFINELGQVIFYIVSCPPLAGMALVVLSAPLAYGLVERLLGGSGVPSTTRVEPSEIESVVLRRLVERMLNGWRDEWSEVMEVTPHVEAMETDAQFVQIASAGETVVHVALEIAYGEVAGNLDIVITCASAERAVERLCRREWFKPAETTRSRAARQHLEAQLSLLRVPLVARLGMAHLSMRQVVGLREGDLLRLDTKADGDIVLLVGDRPKFRCRPGVVGKRLGAQVTALMEEEEASE